MPTRRVAVVTGGSRGLGRALVFAFAREGYRVFTTSRGGRRLSEVAQAAEAQGLDVVTVQSDVTNPDDNARLCKHVADLDQRVDVLIHNAALLGSRDPLREFPTDVFRDVLRANVLGPFDLTKQLLPLMRSRASIHFVSSGVSERAKAGWGAYGISKAALDRLAQTLALELRDDGLRVYIIDPGRMRTEMRAAAYPQEDPRSLDPPDRRTGVFLWLADEGTLAQSGERFSAPAFQPAG